MPDKKAKPKKVKIEVLTRKQKQAQRQSVVVNIHEPKTKARARRRRAKPEPKPEAKPNQIPSQVQYPSTIYQVQASPMVASLPNQVRAVQPVLPPRPPSAVNQVRVARLSQPSQPLLPIQEEPTLVPVPVLPVQPLPAGIAPLPTPASILTIASSAAATTSISEQEDVAQEADVRDVKNFSFPAAIPTSLEEKLLGDPQSLNDLEMYAQQADNETIQSEGAEMISLGGGTTPRSRPQRLREQLRRAASYEEAPVVDTEAVPLGAVSVLGPESLMSSTQGEIKAPPPAVALLTQKSSKAELDAFITEYIPVSEMKSSDYNGQRGAWSAVKRYYKKYKIPAGTGDY